MVAIATIPEARINKRTTFRTDQWGNGGEIMQIMQRTQMHCVLWTDTMKETTYMKGISLHKSIAEDATLEPEV